MDQWCLGDVDDNIWLVQVLVSPDTNGSVTCTFQKRVICKMNAEQDCLVHRGKPSTATPSCFLTCMISISIEVVESGRMGTVVNNSRNNESWNASMRFDTKIFLECFHAMSIEFRSKRIFATSDRLMRNADIVWLRWEMRTALQKRLGVLDIRCSVGAYDPWHTGIQRIQDAMSCDLWRALLWYVQALKREHKVWRTVAIEKLVLCFNPRLLLSSWLPSLLLFLSMDFAFLPQHDKNHPPYGSRMICPCCHYQHNLLRY